MLLLARYFFTSALRAQDTFLFDSNTMLTSPIFNTELKVWFRIKTELIAIDCINLLAICKQTGQIICVCGS